MPTWRTPGTPPVDDLLGERVPPRAGLDVQAHREGRGWRAALRVVDREPNRAERRRVCPGSRLQRVRARARDREAAVGVPMQSAGEEWAGTERRRRRRREGVRAHPDDGVRAERRHWPDELGQQRSPAQGAGYVRDPASGGQRAGVSGQPIRLGARRRGAAGAERVKWSGGVEVQYRRRPRAGRASRSASAPAVRGRRRWSVATGR